METDCEVLNVQLLTKTYASLTILKVVRSMQNISALHKCNYNVFWALMSSRNKTGLEGTNPKPFTKMEAYPTLPDSDSGVNQTALTESK